MKNTGSDVVIPAALLSRNPSVFPDYLEIKALDPGLKPAGVTQCGLICSWIMSVPRSSRFERPTVFQASDLAGGI
jgi:hypothetical protein